ncbi:MAG TPA: 2-amino-4-hydroxy-6-hydroxymethyldihydropteridine diphosphokinase [Chthoniobacteraceae bacterium]|jgi:2-amino-4-hydroxy-6-hydroxymethyldihydropteridine diphosphokinase
MRAGIAFGSNLGDRLRNLSRARDQVLELAGVTPPVRSSRIYETEPVDSTAGAGPYLNAVVEVEYHGQPLALLDGLQAIEASLGRPSKRPRNAPRAIDLDILYVGNLALSNDEAVIPHPRLAQRRFVLIPLAELRPELVLPGQEQNIADLLAAVNDPAEVVIFPETWPT